MEYRNLGKAGVKVSVIAGATTPEQVSENAKKIEWKLSEEAWSELQKLL